MSDIVEDIKNKTNVTVDSVSVNTVIMKENEIIIPETSIAINITMRYILNELVLGYEEQIKPIRLTGYPFYKTDDCLVKAISDRDIISKYLTKMDFKFLSSLSQVFDLLDNTYFRGEE